MKRNVIITKLRAAAGVSFSNLKQSQLGVERTDEKKNQLLSRQVSLTERLDKERHLNKMLQQTVEETELKAATAFEGISLASQKQATLVKRSATLFFRLLSAFYHLTVTYTMIYQRRLNDFSSEIAYLKDVVNEQQSKISTYQKTAVSSNCSVTDSAAPDTGLSTHINDSSVTADFDRATNAATATAHGGPYNIAADRSEKPLSHNDDEGQGFGRRLTMQENSAGMAGKSQDEVVPNEESSQPVKRRKSEPSDHSKASPSASMEVDQADHQYWGVGEDTTQVPLGPLNSVMKSARSEVSTAAHQNVSPAMESLQQAMDDDRCPICLDNPFGLMVLCSGCRNALHSACAKRTGGGATGIPAVCSSFAVTAVKTQLSVM
jgi:hypothetical protein